MEVAGAACSGGGKRTALRAPGSGSAATRPRRSASHPLVRSRRLASLGVEVVGKVNGGGERVVLGDGGGLPCGRVLT
jgi:hypothetical protein